MGARGRIRSRHLLAKHPPCVLDPHFVGDVVRDSRTSWANGAFGRHERHDSDGIRLVTAELRCRSSVRRSTACVVRQAGQRTHKYQ